MLIWSFICRWYSECAITIYYDISKLSHKLKFANPPKKQLIIVEYHSHTIIKNHFASYENSRLILFVISVSLLRFFSQQQWTLNYQMHIGTIKSFWNKQRLSVKIVSGITLYLISRYVFIKTHRKLAKLPPGYVGLPVFGSLFQFGAQKENTLYWYVVHPRGRSANICQKKKYITAQGPSI